MLALYIRTDKPESELYVYRGEEKLAERKWLAHQDLADTLHGEIEKILTKVRVTFSELEKVVVFEGPGSFTGLRIGFSVANSLGYSLEIPVVGSGGEDWVLLGLESKIVTYTPVLPTYGSDPHITKPKK